MGYETKLIIGRSCQSTKEVSRGELVLEDGEAYRPYLKDDKENYIYTGREEIYFMVYATIDLCKCGSDSAISKIDWTNKEKDTVFWYFYDGKDQINEDCYGDCPKPLPLSVVLEALRIDSKEGDYRRFKWAVSLLESMENDSENIQVLFYGH
jgi:hypothetical protein